MSMSKAMAYTRPSGRTGGMGRGRSATGAGRSSVNTAIRGVLERASNLPIRTDRHNVGRADHYLNQPTRLGQRVIARHAIPDDTAPLGRYRISEQFTEYPGRPPRGESAGRNGATTSQLHDSI